MIDLQSLRDENEMGCAIIEHFEVGNTHLVVLKNIKAQQLYLHEYWWVPGEWRFNITPLHSIETAAHLILHAVRYWQGQQND